MSLLDLAPVVPVVVIEDAGTAVPMARALVAGGLPVIEVTLRTPAAREAIARIAEEVPEATVGAGTIRTTEDIAASVSAGAKFLVSPGTTLSLVEALDSSGVPYLPGAATVSEVMALVERGIKELKFFPAEAAGGIPYLKSLSGPLPDVRFCPTGGIKPETARDYLALPNVGCVGGSWLTPADALAAGDWARVEKLAAEAAALR
ncbi:bifunctional 4-hydroxy-2-oxoglutarate aldolase/2-dehydro-3-deoxy-phosphogluconate aldolase [Nonomuraea gerenzanensis]|uniref:2-dehydro-3-deoxy-phosphogluconate aldolase n=1 Tax=Nonomuraea gerenzanensis TaxID=93944 RepID=Q70AQ8_9ACTN|nr:bifunctional 4-hydroxy-2-oxoglutarate aldolase/2-dehydro-3-deoxy-phosphogluconate aldolase [Nonomuraea gerenzanensis]UBU17330.1 bifunctional 4-hydroxy-2-oxoglutarate aldolase/2-dehydro-3-deoxy-phosphogluconate aldolase [Nonomuraea gerenzanensis]CAE53635.1 2-dehydro-3-deoxyphosphogluconate aldolase [Nonomuraea gerenzanensis]SBO95077.1 4-Hydroxy-2-oxoglutarate aldolase / 2-dehydro-3-deoxyphosphogluconate aldolase [Nonomuraea gerenzanensis]